MASAQTPRLFHSTAVLLPDGRILTMGGTSYQQTEIYEPPYLFKGTRPVISSAPTSVSYGQTFFVQKTDAASISKLSSIRLSSVTHGFNWISVSADSIFLRPPKVKRYGALQLVAFTAGLLFAVCP